MKVRSWGELMLILLLGGITIAYGYKRMAEQDLNGLIIIGIAVLLLVRGIPEAYSEEKYEKSAYRAYAARWYSARKFGRFAPVMPWLGALLLILDGMLVVLLPITMGVRVLAGLLLGAAPVSTILYGVWQRRQMDGMDDEEEAQIEADYAVYQAGKRRMEAEDRRRWGIFASVIPWLGAIPSSLGLLLYIRSDEQFDVAVAVLLCTGMICLIVGDLWKTRRTERWAAAEKERGQTDNSEQHL